METCRWHRRAHRRSDAAENARRGIENSAEEGKRERIWEEVIDTRDRLHPRRRTPNEETNIDDHRIEKNFSEAILNFNFNIAKKPSVWKSWTRRINIETYLSKVIKLKGKRKNIWKTKEKECLIIEAFSPNLEVKQGYSLSQQQFYTIECTWARN